MNIRSLPFVSLLIALVAGAVNVFSFAPFGWWPVGILTLAVIFELTLRTQGVRVSTLIGWSYGFGWCASGVWWLYVSMHRFGGMPAWMAALAVVLLSLYLGLFAAFAMGLSAWLKRRWSASDTVTALLILPSLWALCEWMRGWVFTGLPWVVSGYAHTDSPLAGYAPLAGVFGIGWFAAVVAGCIALLPRIRRRMLPIALAAVVVAAGYCMAQVEWTEPAGEPISVRLLQGNVPQEMKFAQRQIVAALILYHDLITSQPADLIATPETAIPIFAQQLPPDYLPRLSAFAEGSGSHIALGIPISDGPRQYANSVIGMAPGAKPEPAGFSYRYDKHHLVPFGEFVPSGFRWFVNMMNIPLGDFERGHALQQPFSVRDQWVLPNICYEDLFGEEIADQIASGFYAGQAEATILLNMSNIAWFGDTIALPQHLQISQMRSLEMGRPMLRSTNTGVTAVIDHKGRVIDQLPTYKQGALATSVQGYKGATPYIRFGNGAVIALALVALACARLLSARRN